MNERHHHAYNVLHRCSSNWYTWSWWWVPKPWVQAWVKLPQVQILVVVANIHVLPVEHPRKMLLHIEEALSLTKHLPVSSEDTLHLYRYLHTHILIADEQILLLINVPIHDHAQQLEIYEVFNLVIHHGNFSACYNINSTYLGITYDEIKAVEILEQFSICQKANRQFCSSNAPFQPLTNPPSCIAAIYAKNKAGIEKRCSLQIRNANSVSLPTSIAPNVWIVTSAPMVVSTGMTLTLIHQNADTHPHS